VQHRAHRAVAEQWTGLDALKKWMCHAGDSSGWRGRHSTDAGLGL
jgi:hypothetical protein